MKKYLVLVMLVLMQITPLYAARVIRMNRCFQTEVIPKDQHKGIYRIPASNEVYIVFDSNGECVVTSSSSLILRMSVSFYDVDGRCLFGLVDCISSNNPFNVPNEIIEQSSYVILEVGEEYYKGFLY